MTPSLERADLPSPLRTPHPSARPDRVGRRAESAAQRLQLPPCRDLARFNGGRRSTRHSSLLSELGKFSKLGQLHLLGLPLSHCELTLLLGLQGQIVR